MSMQHREVEQPYVGALHVRTVIVPLDGSSTAERALPVAAEAARTFGADVRLVTTRWGTDADEPRDYLHGKAAELERADMVVVQDRTAGPAIELVAHKAARPIVVMTTHGRSGIGAALLGSTAEAVLRHVGCPVLLVGPQLTAHPTQGRGDVLVPVDREPRSHAVARLAAEWARGTGHAVRLLTVLAPGEDEDAAHVVLDGVAAQMREETAGGADLAVVTEVVRGSAPAEAIVERSRAIGASWIAIATHARAGMRRVTLGSVTMATVHDAPCPVLVLGPGVIDG